MLIVKISINLVFLGHLISTPSEGGVGAIPSKDGVGAIPSMIFFTKCPITLYFYYEV